MDGLMMNPAKCYYQLRLRRTLVLLVILFTIKQITPSASKKGYTGRDDN